MRLTVGNFVRKMNPSKLEKIHFGTVLYIIPLIPLTIFVFTVFNGLTNVPRYDDWGDCLAFLTDFYSTPEPYAKFKLVFGFHNVHRTVVNKIVYLFSDYIGHLDFRALAAFGSSSRLLIFIFLINWVKKYLPSFSVQVSLVCSFVIFSLAAGSQLTWAMASISNTWVFLFLILALYLIMQDGKTTFALASFFGFCSIYTQASGVFIFFPVAVLITDNLFSKSYTHKRLLAFFLIMVFFVAIYFMGHHRTPGLSVLIKELTKITVIQRFFILLGRTLSYGEISISLTAGILLLINFVFGAYATRSDRRSHLWILVGLFVLASAGSIALGRRLSGVQQAYVQRYCIVSELFFITNIILSAIWITNNKRNIYKHFYFLIILVLSVTTWLTTLEKGYNGIIKHRIWSDKNFKIFLHTKDYRRLILPNRLLAKNIFDKAICVTSYCPWITYSDCDVEKVDMEKFCVSPMEVKNSLIFDGEIDKFEKGYLLGRISGQGILKQRSKPILFYDEPIIIIANKEGKGISLSPHAYSKCQRCRGSQQKYFDLFFPSSIIPEGNYNIYFHFPDMGNKIFPIKNKNIL